MTYALDNPIHHASKLLGRRATRAAVRFGQEPETKITRAEAERRLRAVKGRKSISIKPGVEMMLVVANHVRKKVEERRRRARVDARPIAERLEMAQHRKRAGLVDKCYRQTTSSWVGGRRGIEIGVGLEPHALGKSEMVYHPTKIRSGTNSHLHVVFSPSWHPDVELAGLAKIGRMVTTHATEIENGLWEAAWVKQGKGFQLHAERGYIARSPDGTTLAHGKTPGGARRSAHLQSPAGAKEQAAAEARRAQAAEEREVETLQALESGDLDGTLVTWDHARGAGLCSSGIESWLARNFGDPDIRALSVGQIRKVADQPALVRLACRYAIKRRGAAR